MPKKRVKLVQQDNRWVTAGIKVSGKKLRFINSIMKERNITDQDKKYYSNY
jgi:hypothetical protein